MLRSRRAILERQWDRRQGFAERKEPVAEEQHGKPSTTAILEPFGINAAPFLALFLVVYTRMSPVIWGLGHFDSPCNAVTWGYLICALWSAMFTLLAIVGSTLTAGCDLNLVVNPKGGEATRKERARLRRYQADWAETIFAVAQLHLLRTVFTQGIAYVDLEILMPVVASRILLATIGASPSDDGGFILGYFFPVLAIFDKGLIVLGRLTPRGPPMEARPHRQELAMLLERNSVTLSRAQATAMARAEATEDAVGRAMAQAWNLAIVVSVGLVNCAVIFSNPVLMDICSPAVILLVVDACLKMEAILNSSHMTPNTRQYIATRCRKILHSFAMCVRRSIPGRYLEGTWESMCAARARNRLERIHEEDQERKARLDLRQAESVWHQASAPEERVAAERAMLSAREKYDQVLGFKIAPEAGPMQRLKSRIWYHVTPILIFYPPMYALSLYFRDEYCKCVCHRQAQLHYFLEDHSDQLMPRAMDQSLTAIGSLLSFMSIHQVKLLSAALVVPIIAFRTLGTTAKALDFLDTQARNPYTTDEKPASQKPANLEYSFISRILDQPLTATIQDIWKLVCAATAKLEAHIQVWGRSLQDCALFAIDILDVKTCSYGWTSDYERLSRKNRTRAQKRKMEDLVQLLWAPTRIFHTTNLLNIILGLIYWPRRSGGDLAAHWLALFAGYALVDIVVRKAYIAAMSLIKSDTREEDDWTRGLCASGACHARRCRVKVYEFEERVEYAAEQLEKIKEEAETLSREVQEARNAAQSEQETPGTRNENEEGWTEVEHESDVENDGWSGYID